MRDELWKGVARDFWIKKKKTKQLAGMRKLLGGDTDLDRKTRNATIERQRERLEESENQHKKYKNILTPQGENGNA